jgi:iron complex outermembrane recepter protein
MRRTPTIAESRPALKPLTVAVAAALGSTLVANDIRAQVRELPMEEIVVTASRRESTVQDVPINITAVSGDVLEQQRITSLNSFSRDVAGLTLVDQGPRSADLMIVRGLNVSSLNDSEFLLNGSGDTVGTYIGDIPLYVDMKMIDIDRVEVLLGPQGTLYGEGTLGGAIRYIPKRPDTEEFQLDAHGGVYSIAESDSLGYTTDAVINVPISEDKLGFRAAISYLDNPGFIDYDYLIRQPGVSNPQPDFTDPADVAANLYSVKDANTERTLMGRASLLWRPTNAIDINFSWLHQDQKGGGRSINNRHALNTAIPNRNTLETDKYVSGQRYLEPKDRQNDLLSIELVADLGFAELTSATGYSEYDELGHRDQTDLLLDLSFDGGYYYEEFPLFSAFTTDGTTENRWNQELRLVSTSPGPWNWIVGVFYNKFKEDAFSFEFTPGLSEFFYGPGWPTGDLEYEQYTKGKTVENAVFGELGYQLTDRWAITIGARRFDYDVDTTNTISFPLIASVGDPERVVFSDDGVLGKFNLAYTPNDNITAYLTVSEGYRLGGFNAVIACGDLPPNTQAGCALPDEQLIKPDTTLNTEIGVHSQMLEGRLIVNGAIYNIDWDDIQVDGSTVNGAIPITVNGGTARTRGAEVSARLSTHGPFAFWGTYAYNNAELTSFAPGLVDSSDPLTVDNGNAYPGDRLAGSPKNMASFNVDYYRQLSNGWALDVNYGVSYTSDVLTRVGMRNNGEKLSGYTLHSASVGFSKDRWSTSIYADNLTNEFVETSVRKTQALIRDIGSNNFRSRRYFRNVLQPRVVGVEFRYSM